jgi:hypothetical protein
MVIFDIAFSPGICTLIEYRRVSVVTTTIMPATSAIKRIADKGNKIFEDRIKPALGKEQVGKFVAIEIETGDYVIGDTPEGAVFAAKEKYPEKIFHLVRVGYPGVYGISTIQPADYEWLR